MSFNGRAFVKFVVVIITLFTVYQLDFPIVHLWIDWVKDVVRFSQDPYFYDSYSTTAKVLYFFFPQVFVIGGLLWYFILWRQRRKNYYACGWPQGTVMWVFNKPGRSRGHIYDFFSALHGFRDIPWEKIPRPVTGDYFDGATVIYWRTSFFTSPWKWNKDLVFKPKKYYNESAYTVYAMANKRTNHRHKYNPRLDYNLLTNADLYKHKKKSLETAMQREKTLNYQITEDVQRLARANPEVANNMANLDIPIPRMTREKLIALKGAKSVGEQQRQDPARIDAVTPD